MLYFTIKSESCNGDVLVDVIRFGWIWQADGMDVFCIKLSIVRFFKIVLEFDLVLFYLCTRRRLRV
jgi:hypothetical protein